MKDKYRYYETLGLDRSASLSEINKAYRSLAKTYHPDVSSHPRARENFQKIQQAYEALSDPETRHEYDAYLDALEELAPDEDTNDVHIENEFYVHNEPITIKGRPRVLDCVHHVIADGQEYIEYDGEFLSFDRGFFPFDTREIDGEFYVPNEDITINGNEYTFRNAHHVSIRGREYIEYNGNFLLFERHEYQDTPSPSGRGFLKTLGNLILILVVALTLYHGFTLATSGDADATPSSSIVAAGTSTPKATSTPVTSFWSTQSSKVAEAMDYTNPTTRDYALSLIDREHSGKYNIAQICDMWEKLYKRWTYVNDPNGFNYYSPASRTINLGLKGDCDDFAILTASSIQAIGGASRIIIASNTGGGGHAYAEVYISSSKSDLQSVADYICQRYKCKSIAYRTTNEGGQTRYWLNLDWQAKHPGGPYYQNSGETIAIYPNKYWVKLK
jgi:hypothetical protein